MDSTPKFLIDALRVIDDEEVDLYMVNPKAPCFIKNAEESYIYPDPSRELYNSCLNLRTEVKSMHTIRLKDDYIKLGQALKAAGW